MSQQSRSQAATDWILTKQ